MQNDDGRTDRATQTYERLRELIVQGQLAPGTRIIESDVADRLGVSRTPVRAALQRLEQEGFILNDPSGQRWRPSVSPLTVKDSDELFRLIGQLEGLAAWYASHLDEAEHRRLVERMEACNRRLEESTGDLLRSPTDSLDSDEAFHWSMVEAAAGPRLRALVRSVRPQAERYVRVYVNAFIGEVDRALEEHARIIRAIRERDADGAQRAVEGNWRAAAARVAGVIRLVGERGSW